MEPTNVFGLQFDGPAGLRTVIKPQVVSRHANQNGLDRLLLSFG